MNTKKHIYVNFAVVAVTIASLVGCNNQPKDTAKAETIVEDTTAKDLSIEVRDGKIIKGYEVGELGYRF